MACEKFEKGSKAYIACMSNIGMEPGEKPVEGGQTTSYSKLLEGAKDALGVTPFGMIGKASEVLAKKGAKGLDKKKMQQIMEKRKAGK